MKELKVLAAWIRFRVPPLFLLPVTATNYVSRAMQCLWAAHSLISDKLWLFGQDSACAQAACRSAAHLRSAFDINIIPLKNRPVLVAADHNIAETANGFPGRNSSSGSLGYHADTCILPVSVAGISLDCPSASDGKHLWVFLQPARHWYRLAWGAVFLSGGGRAEFSALEGAILFGRSPVRKQEFSVNQTLLQLLGIGPKFRSARVSGNSLRHLAQFATIRRLQR